MVRGGPVQGIGIDVLLSLKVLIFVHFLGHAVNFLMLFSVQCRCWRICSILFLTL